MYDRLSYVPFTRIATLSPDLANITMTVGSAGKSFWATGWRVGWLIGPEHLIKHCVTAHTRICYCGVAPLQKALAMGLEQASQSNFWKHSRDDMLCKMKTFNRVWDELGISVSLWNCLCFTPLTIYKVHRAERRLHGSGRFL